MFIENMHKAQDLFRGLFKTFKGTQWLNKQLTSKHYNDLDLEDNEEKRWIMR